MCSCGVGSRDVEPTTPASAGEIPDRAVAIPDGGASRLAPARSDERLLEVLLEWSRGAGRILEYGAGDGRFAGALRERGCDVVAIEVDASQREAIRARGVPVGKSLEVLGDERFGAVYALSALERVENDSALLAALREHLAPGGRLLLCVPAFPILRSERDARSGCLRRYRRRALEATVHGAGFRVTRIRHLDSLGFAVALWRRWIGEGGVPRDAARVRLEARAAQPLSRALDALSSGAIGTRLLCEAVRSG
jgi:SAM-dependent methyltransferase